MSYCDALETHVKQLVFAHVGSASSLMAIVVAFLGYKKLEQWFEKRLLLDRDWSTPVDDPRPLMKRWDNRPDQIIGDGAWLPLELPAVGKAYLNMIDLVARAYGSETDPDIQHRLAHHLAREVTVALVNTRRFERFIFLLENAAPRTQLVWIVPLVRGYVAALEWCRDNFPRVLLWPMPATDATQPLPGIQSPDTAMFCTAMFCQMAPGLLGTAETTSALVARYACLWPKANQKLLPVLTRS